MEDVPCFYYESASLEQKYQWMHSGPGGAAAVGFGDGLAKLAADFNASDANIGRNLVQRRLGTEWQGQAATAATEALNRAASAIAANAAPGITGRESSHQYGDSFNATRNAIQLVPDAGSNSWWGRQADAAGSALNDTFGSTFGVQSDYAKRLAAYRDADQAANDALYRHETTSRTVLAAYQSAITGQAAALASGPAAGTHSDQPTQAGGAHGGPAAGGPGAAGAAPAARAAPAGAAGGGPGSGAGRADPTGVSPGGVGGAGRHGAGQGTEALSTAPGAGFAPLIPAGNAPVGLQPGPTGGYVPADPGAGSVPPPLPPLDGGFAGSGHGNAGYSGPGYGGAGGGAGYRGAGGGAGYGGAAGYGGERSLAPRGGPSAEGGGRAAVAGGLGEAGAAARAGAGAAGPAGMPMGGAGGAAGQDREHRNTVYLPDDEPFRVDFDDVTGSVIGLPEEPR